MRARYFFQFAAAALLSGCISLAPHYERPPIELPVSWTGVEGRDATSIGTQWWKIYNDAQLDGFIEEAFAHNTDLEAAVARVDEARGLLGQSRSQQFPSLDAEATHSRTQASLKGANPLPPGYDRTTEDNRVVLKMAYELDLWGRLYNASKAARAEALASEAAQQTVKIALAAAVVENYFSLRTLDEQVSATKRSVDTRTETLGLQKIRADSGVISEFEYRQMEAEVLAARAQLPILLDQRARQENAFAVLLGRSPRAMYDGTDIGPVPSTTNISTEIDAAALVVPSGLPSELLLRRPDLVEAEQHLMAANARVGVARAAYFPSISLTGFIGAQSALPADLSSDDAHVGQGAATLLQPIFGLAAANALVNAANARQRQSLAQYRRAIQNAFRDVRDAIATQQHTREQFDAEDKRVATLREGLRLAKLRYDNGLASQLDVLDSERNLLAAELGRSDALRGQRVAIANLFKALGGGWRPDP